MQFQYEKVDVHKRSKLPHWEVKNGLYSVTLRVGDSLPQSVVAQLESERRALTNSLKVRGELRPQQFGWIDSLMRKRIEEHLDAGWGECPFRRKDVAAVVAEALGFFEGERYQMLAWCIMPNHLHTVFDLLSPNTLAAVIHSWKSFTAKQINPILGREGLFWHPDYYDRTVRNKRHLERAIEYVRDNPAKAGLKNWSWVYVAENAFALLS